jgi:hypothetical protein
LGVSNTADAKALIVRTQETTEKGTANIFLTNANVNQCRSQRNTVELHSGFGLDAPREIFLAENQLEHAVHGQDFDWQATFP